MNITDLMDYLTLALLEKDEFAVTIIHNRLIGKVSNKELKELYSYFI